MLSTTSNIINNLGDKIDGLDDSDSDILRMDPNQPREKQSIFEEDKEENENIRQTTQTMQTQPMETENEKQIQ